MMTNDWRYVANFCVTHSTFSLNVQKPHRKYKKQQHRHTPSWPFRMKGRVNGIPHQQRSTISQMRMRMRIKHLGALAPFISISVQCAYTAQTYLSTFDVEAVLSFAFKWIYHTRIVDTHALPLGVISRSPRVCLRVFVFVFLTCLCSSGKWPNTLKSFNYYYQVNFELSRFKVKVRTCASTRKIGAKKRQCEKWRVRLCVWRQVDFQMS